LISIQKNGQLHAWALLKVVDSVSDPRTEIHIEKASILHPGSQLGEFVEKDIDPSYLGRIAAQTARQAIMQRLRQFEVPYAELPQENMLQSAALDKGYDANRIREILTLDGIGPVIPGRSNRREVIIYDRVKYAKRNVAERFFNKLKQFRRIATRFEKYAHTLLAMTHIVAAFYLCS